MNENEKEELNRHIRKLENSIKFLSSQEDTEIWVVNEFLTNLNIEFDRNEIQKVNEEPTDIIFRKANFQVKAIYEEDRQMIKEYKDALEQAKKATTFSEALIMKKYTPKDISIQEIVDLINVILEGYKLSPEQYERIDMLFYFNRPFHEVAGNQEYIFPKEELWRKWRSVSMLKNGGVNFVFWTKESAPAFIESNVGKIIFKNNPQQLNAADPPLHSE